MLKVSRFENIEWIMITLQELLNLERWSLRFIAGKIKSVVAYRASIVVIILKGDLSNSKVSSKTESC